MMKHAPLELYHLIMSDSNFLYVGVAVYVCVCVYIHKYIKCVYVHVLSIAPSRYSDIQVFKFIQIE